MHLFVLTGAGISAESGLKTFRDPGGLWEHHDPMSLATPEAFARDPALVHRFYDWRRATAAAAAPNAAHHALARLERDLVARGDAMTLVTQNVDFLHERAGSTVIAMHGTHTEARCTRCGDIRLWTGDMSVATPCPACGQRGGLRPNIVWFGEMPHHLDRIAARLETADAFVAIGTSGAVYPAAAYVGAAQAAGIVTCELNLAPADNAGLFDRALYGKATETVPELVEMVLSGRLT
jgi:NAD-dependent protein deacetylases, SIR2 family